jgi:hypothetical protein
MLVSVLNCVITNACGPILAALNRRPRNLVHGQYEKDFEKYYLKTVPSFVPIDQTWCDGAYIRACAYE